MLPREQCVFLLLLAFSFICISLSHNESSHQINGIDSEMDFSSLFTPSFVSDVSKQLNLSVISLEDKQRILIISEARSGSTFTGDLLQQAWSSYYLIEPLIYYEYSFKDINIRFNENNKTEAIRDLVGLFQCIGISSYSKLDFKLYINWQNMVKHAMLIQGELIDLKI